MKQTDKVPKEFVLGGTETYGNQTTLPLQCSERIKRLIWVWTGAPERHPGRRGTRIAVPQTIDTWSLGCVFSIAATWVALGRQGIPQYQKMREKAIKKIIDGQSSLSSTKKANPALNEGDYFHEGRQVLADVKTWHDFLRKTLRKTDTITSKVIDLIDQKMLLDNAAKRLNAKDICAELKKITDQSQQEPRELMPESIMAALLEVDEQAPSQSAEIASHEVPSRSPTDSDNRKARKSKLLDRPLMKTTHRSEYLKSALAAQNPEPDSSGSPYNRAVETGQARHDSPLNLSPSRHFQDLPQMSDLRIPQSNLLQQVPSDHRTTSDRSIPTALSRAKQPKTTKMTQNVFQAREEIEKRKKGDLWRRSGKDKLLTRHFTNRDIVSLSKELLEFFLIPY